MLLAAGREEAIVDFNSQNGQSHGQSEESLPNGYDKRAQLVIKNLQKVRVFVRSMIVSHHDIEDICQEVAVRAMSHSGDFDNIFGWMCRVARNLVFERNRKKKDVKLAVDPNQESASANNKLYPRCNNHFHGCDDYLEDQDLLRALKTEIGRLSDRERTWLMLRYDLSHVFYEVTDTVRELRLTKTEAMSASEIAECFGCSKRTVELRLKIAIEKLENFLKSFHPNDNQM